MNFTQVRKFFYLLIFLAHCPLHGADEELSSQFEEAEKGSKSALYNLGVRYATGNGVRQDYERANEYYKAAALQGYSAAQNNLGWSYRKGLGMPKSPSKAIYWFRLSALQGNALALQNLAEIFRDGDGVKVNLEISKSFYIFCATETTNKELGREDGINNAVHECRREMAKISALSESDDQRGLRMAAIWLSAALFEDSDLEKDSEIGVRARRSRKETQEIFNRINEKLTEDSKQWVAEVMQDWNDFKFMMRDRTKFPLIGNELDSLCESSDSI